LGITASGKKRNERPQQESLVTRAYNKAFKRGKRYTMKSVKWGVGKEVRRHCERE